MDEIRDLTQQLVDAINDLPPESYDYMQQFVPFDMGDIVDDLESLLKGIERVT